jgi:hypothetical protein
VLVQSARRNRCICIKSSVTVIHPDVFLAPIDSEFRINMSLYLGAKK